MGVIKIFAIQTDMGHSVSTTLERFQTLTFNTTEPVFNATLYYQDTSRMTLRLYFRCSIQYAEPDTSVNPDSL